jgi:hypothetical protein
LGEFTDEKYLDSFAVPLMRIRAILYQLYMTRKVDAEPLSYASLFGHVYTEIAPIQEFAKPLSIKIKHTLNGSAPTVQDSGTSMGPLELGRKKRQRNSDEDEDEYQDYSDGTNDSSKGEQRQRAIKRAS